jgi:cytochrome c-type biogenesis protein CcmF
MWRSGTHESYIMPVVAIGQFFLTTMVWGVKIGNFILGQSPFILMREMPENAGVGFFKDPNYLAQIADGNGINPLLENVWMVTHPPLLFLGYSAALIPFAYVIAALWKGDFRSWLKPALPWTVFAVITLGGGILLGGAWAYESLTFGGFWSWDPVENASLIPWLFIVAALHMMILNKRRDHSYTLSFLFIILGYVFVVYASYLTRSGVLGETSAHAFGNNGLSAQMVIIILLTGLFSLFLFFKNLKRFPCGINDRFFSREFWMYLGALVMVLAAFQVFATTSIPVFNKILGTSIAPPADRVAFYNRWQLPFAVVIVLMIGGAMLLRYGKNNEKDLFRRFTYVFGAAAVLFFVEILLFRITGWTFLLFLLFINFALTASAYSLFTGKINKQSLANMLSHFGFALFLLGVLVAFSKAEVISKNTSRYDLGDKESNRENQVLIKGHPENLGDYWVVYDDLKRKKNFLHYTVKFYNDKDTSDLAFTIHPDININNRMGNVYNPSTHHTVSKDVFTFITYANLEADYNNYGYLLSEEKEITQGDTMVSEAGLIVFRNMALQNSGDSIDVNNVTIRAGFDLLRPHDTIPLITEFRIVNGSKDFLDAEIDSGKYLLRFGSISTKPKTIGVALFKKRLNYIVVKTTVFPWISLLLAGGLLMFAGLFISLWRHIKISN